MAKLSAADRQSQIVEMINQNGTMKIKDLARHFDVSRETIRRDMNTLNEDGRLKKWIGGSVAANDFTIQPVNTRLSMNQDRKIKLGEVLFDLIPEGSVIFIDAGSTTLCFAQALSNRSGYTVITNSVAAAGALANGNNKVILTGGTLNPNVMELTGMQAADFLDHIKADVAVLGSEGFLRHNGPSSNDLDDIQIKKTAIRNAMTSIVVADSSKASSCALMEYANWKDIDYLVTDESFPEAERARIAEDTDVIIVPTQSDNVQSTADNPA